MSRPVYCDESVWVPVADGLSRRGWETHHAREEDTLGSSDREQLSYAGERDWVLLTFDDDFLSLVEGEGLDHEGILYVDQTGKGIGDVVKAVDGFLGARDGPIGRAVHYL